MLTIALAICGSAVAQPPSLPEYIEVIGRLENLDYESVYNPDDFLGHGWITARLHVARVLGRKRLPKVLSVRYFAHSFMQEKEKARFKLHRTPDGEYLVCAPPGGTGVRCP